MARGRRRRRRKYATILDVVGREDIYLVNMYRTVFKIDGKPTDLVSDSLTHVGQNAVGIVLGGCLVAVAATDPAGDTVGGSHTPDPGARSLYVVCWSE